MCGIGGQHFEEILYYNFVIEKQGRVRNRCFEYMISNTGWKIFYLCLLITKSEADSQLIEPDPQMFVRSRNYYNLVGVGGTQPGTFQRQDKHYPASIM